MANVTGDANANLIFGDQSDALAPTPQNFIDSQNSNDDLRGLDGNDTIYGLGGNDIIFGNLGNDVLHGDSGDDRIFAGQGNDTVIGGAGNDLIAGNKENDLLFGLDGNDIIQGNLGDDLIFGGDGNDTVTGNENSDQVFGGNGDDLLDGGTVVAGVDNIDVLTGGDGADVFRLRPANQTLTITDYQDGTDKFTIITTDPKDPLVLALGGAPVTAADIEARTQGVDTVLEFIDDNGDPLTIAVLQNVEPTVIDATDFV